MSPTPPTSSRLVYMLGCSICRVMATIKFDNVHRTWAKTDYFDFYYCRLRMYSFSRQNAFEIWPSNKNAKTAHLPGYWRKGTIHRQLQLEVAAFADSISSASMYHFRPRSVAQRDQAARAMVTARVGPHYGCLPFGLLLGLQWEKVHVWIRNAY